MMPEQERAPSTFAQVGIAWIVAGVAFVFYLATLNHWVTFVSVPVVAKVAGWDWNTTLSAPLLHLVTWPFRLLPAAWQPVALNAFTALCAALTLALLARSVALMPQDRTRDQRMRERSEFSLLSIPLAWVPPLFAALVCGLQLTFWEHAVVISGEMLNLLLFAYVIRCLLEFRIDQRESWLYRMAFVYGAAATNNWAMIGFAPLLLVALVWIRGGSFFQLRFLSVMGGLLLLGLLFYLVVPLVEVRSGRHEFTILQMLRAELGAQKAFLLSRPLRNTALVCSLTSLLPLLFCSIRWPSHFGDLSPAGAALTNFLLRVMHGVFFVVCLWVAFDPQFSPRQVGRGIPFLTFYYVAALCIGYLTGYLLLVLGVDPEKAWHRPSNSIRSFNRALCGLVCVAAAAVPVGLVTKNLPVIRVLNGPSLFTAASAAIQALPEKGAVLISDDAASLSLMRAALSRQPRSVNHILLGSDVLGLKAYQRWLSRQYGDRYPTPPLDKLSDPIQPGNLLQLLFILNRTNELFYLHPSFGFYFEYFQGRPRGLVQKLEIIPDLAVTGPPLTQEEIEQNEAVWAGFDFAPVKRGIELKVADAQVLGAHLSRALNYWGVCLQQANRLDQAQKYFELALELNSDNIAALINKLFNQKFRRGESTAVDLEKSVQDRLLGQYPNWMAFLRACGPADEPNFCYNLGQAFVKQGYYRQAAQQILRLQQLKPDNVEARLWLASIYERANMPDKVLEAVSELRAMKDPRDLNATNQMELIRLEAWAHFGLTNYDKAASILLEAQPRFPQFDDPLLNLSKMQLLLGDTNSALATLQRQLAITPDNPRALLNEGALYIHMKQHEKAIAPLTRALTLTPRNIPARFNRAIAYLESGQYEAAQRDYEALLEIEPEFNTARFQLGEVALRRKDLAGAKTHFERFLEHAPPDGEETRRAKARLEEIRTGKIKG
jgi:tetratricopeptide (TPR) repeat protein